MGWDSICRVCLKSETQGVDINVKVESINDYTYLDLLNICTRLDARSDDQLPMIICITCSNDLFNIFEFINKAVSADTFLRTSIENKKHAELDKDNDRNIKVKQLSLIDVESTTYDERIEAENQSDYEFDSVPENAFEIVQCGSPIQEEDTLIEEFEMESIDIEGTEFAIESVSFDECINQTGKSRNQSVECYACGKMLKQLSLKHHYERCHKKEKLHLCSACPKTFNVPNDLKIHMKTHDKGRERNYVCTVCRKGFFEKQSLSVHMQRHTGIRKHQCEICKKRFTTKKSLEVHEFTHNRQSGRFVCRYCSKRFPSKADVTVHERFHTGEYPYQCEICNKRYAVKSHYNYHLAKHKGVTYKCDKCDKEFMNRGSLNAHKLRHNDRMPHECSICKKGFPSSYNLNRHQKCHKPKDNAVSNK